MIARLVVISLVAAWSTSLRAAEPVVAATVYQTDVAAQDSGVRTVSYSTGQGGHKLKWLPARPSQASIDRSSPRRAAGKREERFAQYTVPVVGKPTEGGAIDPFDDPFEDAKKTSGPFKIEASLSDDLLDPANPQPRLLDSLPQMADDREEKEFDPQSLGPAGRIPESLLEESLAAAPREPEEPCSSIHLKSIGELSHDISAKGDRFPRECPLVDGALPTRWTNGWAPVTFTWKASGLCHKPAYFEDVHLERYGHSWGPYLQPVISGAHFFLTVPILPYKIGLKPPNECVYSLGYYRPGSCAPYMLDPLPVSIRAGLAEAAAWTGGAFLIP
ncbi:MAG: hypothetical protein ABIK89_15540 [Planctomycetota bacterium]